MATLRNKTTSDGVIIRWKPHPDHNRPSTYQVVDQAVSMLADLGFQVLNPGDEVEIPKEVCQPLRKLEDLYFKSESVSDVETEELETIGDDFVQSLSDAQRQRLQNYIATHKNYEKQSENLRGDVSSLSTDSNPDDPDLPPPGEKLLDVLVELDSRDNLCAERDTRIKISDNVDPNDEINIKIEVRRNEYVVASIAEGQIKSSKKSEIERLREEAIDDASQPSAEKSSSQSSAGTQYSRSQKVKEYVKARAGGMCEGCDKPAPFESKRGGAYLHAHHVDELSEGGLDTVEKVIALCPNCHYRVHHGKDGDEYNERLIGKLMDIEFS